MELPGIARTRKFLELQGASRNCWESLQVGVAWNYRELEGIAWNYQELLVEALAGWSFKGPTFKLVYFRCEGDAREY